MSKLLIKILANNSVKTTVLGVLIIGIIGYSIYKGHEMNTEVFIALITALGLMVSGDGDKLDGVKKKVDVKKDDEPK